MLSLALNVNDHLALTGNANPALVNDYTALLFMLIKPFRKCNANPAFVEANPALDINANPDVGKA